MFVSFFLNLQFFCKAVSNVGPYGLFWQPALVCYSSILYLCLLIGQIKMLACLLAVTIEACAAAHRTSKPIRRSSQLSILHQYVCVSTRQDPVSRHEGLSTTRRGRDSWEERSLTPDFQTPPPCCSVPNSTRG